MRNRILKSAWVLAACLPTLALAQQQPAPHREGSWEFSLGGGISILDGALRGFLGAGAPESRFADKTPGRFPLTAAARVGYNFTRHLGVSVGGTAAKGSGVRWLTPDGSITYTFNLNARTSPFILVGTELTRIDGVNDRTMHSTWGFMGGLGLRRMVSERIAFRIEGRMRLEGYQEMPTGKAYTSVATLGFSYFTSGRRPASTTAAPTPCRACTLARVDTIMRVRRDTVVRVRVDTVRVMRVDTVELPSPDQLVLRVQFVTDSTRLLRRTLPLLDTIARAIIATPGSHWEVQGHTDSVGTTEHNRVLAQGRAQAVVDYLVTRGVSRDILSAVGFGEDRPVVSNATVEGRAQNRRVQLRRIPAGPPPGRPVP